MDAGRSEANLLLATIAVSDAAGACRRMRVTHAGRRDKDLLRRLGDCKPRTLPPRAEEAGGPRHLRSHAGY
jgi:hypothetical protein